MGFPVNDFSVNGDMCLAVPVLATGDTYHKGEASESLRLMRRYYCFVKNMNAWLRARRKVQEKAT